MKRLPPPFPDIQLINYLNTTTTTPSEEVPPTIPLPPTNPFPSPPNPLPTLSGHNQAPSHASQAKPDNNLFGSQRRNSPSKIKCRR